MKTGRLYIVATPIGNLEDMTYRAVNVLGSVDIIAAEDTRHSRVLLSHYNIQTPVLSLHTHNEESRTQALITRCLQGDTVALISDAGTPLISDPGYRLVVMAREAGIAVIPLPGACALIAALSVAGLPTDKFCFEGFLPAKSHARELVLTRLQTEARTIVCYEAPHRILALLTSIVHVLGSDRRVVLARELTKLHETVHADRVDALLTLLTQTPVEQKGEFVVLIAGAGETRQDVGEEDRVLSLLLPLLPLKTAVNCAADILKQPKNALYERALVLKSK